MTPPSHAFTDVLARLRRRLAGPLPGAEAQLTMAPSHRLDRALLSVEGKKCREAGVLVLLHPDAHGAACVVLTVRPPEMKAHAGQVAFPGGRREEGETLEAAALREAHEEVALDPADVDVLGPLTPLYVPPSRFCVYPFVAVAHGIPALTPMEAEVAEILRVPLAALFDPANTGVGTWDTVHGLSDVPYFLAGPHRVWGATAMMLAELRTLVAP
jgi:8-oxo-dGTP pyrophosphatase MutT (NUDIX family)